VTPRRRCRARDALKKAPEDELGSEVEVAASSVGTAMATIQATMTACGQPLRERAHYGRRDGRAQRARGNGQRDAGLGA